MSRSAGHWVSISEEDNPVILNAAGITHIGLPGGSTLNNAMSVEIGALDTDNRSGLCYAHAFRLVHMRHT